MSRTVKNKYENADEVRNISFDLSGVTSLREQFTSEEELFINASSDNLSLSLLRLHTLCRLKPISRRQND